ncbi:unnamed protein product [Chrysoparadoxa australica]
MRIAISTCVLVLFAAVAQGFIAPSPPAATAPLSIRQMGFGDAFKKAFENESYSEKPKGGGLSKEPEKVVISVDGKQVTCIPGQKLKDVCRTARVKVVYGCEKGDCGTCEGKTGNGKKIRICTAVVPNQKNFKVFTKK